MTDNDFIFFLFLRLIASHPHPVIAPPPSMPLVSHHPGSLPDWYLLGPHQHRPQVYSTETGPWPDFPSVEGGIRLRGGHTGWGGICRGWHHSGSLPWQTEGERNNIQAVKLLQLTVRKAHYMSLNMERWILHNRVIIEFSRKVQHTSNGAIRYEWM